MSGWIAIYLFLGFVALVGVYACFNMEKTRKSKNKPLSVKEKRKAYNA